MSYQTDEKEYDEISRKMRELHHKEGAKAYAFLCKRCELLWLVYAEKGIPKPAKHRCPWCDRPVGGQEPK